MVGLIKVWPVLAATALLAGCDGGASAVPVHNGEATASAAASGSASAAGGDTPVAAEARVAKSGERDGGGRWSSNRRFTSEQNAQRHFERDGAAFGAKSVDDYVAKARRFVDRPPSGAKTLTRANGDRLIYDPASNVFAVATRDGAPRTMFKPDEGAAYWEKVKAREADGGARSSRRRDDG